MDKTSNKECLSAEEQMQKDTLIRILKKNGCRITRQRMILLDIIIKGNCTSCKDIYYRAVRQDSRIGPATVYRMVKLLEDIGVLNRRNMYKITCDPNCRIGNICNIEMNDHTVYHLTSENWKLIVNAGLKACGYSSEGQDVKHISFSA